MLVLVMPVVSVVPVLPVVSVVLLVLLVPVVVWQLVPVQFVAQQTLADEVLAQAPSRHLYPAFSSDYESHAMSFQL